MDPTPEPHRMIEAYGRVSEVLVCIQELGCVRIIPAALQKFLQENNWSDRWLNCAGEMSAPQRDKTRGDRCRGKRRVDAPEQIGKFRLWKNHAKRANTICLLAGLLYGTRLGHSVLIWGNFGFLR